MLSSSSLEAPDAADVDDCCWSFAPIASVARELLHDGLSTAKVVRAETVLDRASDRPSLTVARSIDDDPQQPLYRIEIMSYGIDSTWNLLRHVYMMSATAAATFTKHGDVRFDEIEPIEIHAGMSNYEEDATDQHRRQQRHELMYSTADYYGRGRSEGYVLLCEKCASAALRSAQRKNDMFYLPFNNCDTIVPFVYQTPLLWCSALYATVGVALSTQTFNVFVFAMFVPFLAFLFTALYNSTVFDEHERRLCELQRCRHSNAILRRARVDAARNKNDIDYDDDRTTPRHSLTRRSRVRTGSSQ